MKSKLNRCRGFTIVEIIVAVVIMAALFTVLANSLSGARARAERSTRQARVREDAIIYREEVNALIAESFKNKDGAEIAKYLSNRHDKDPYGQDYKFTIVGSLLTVKPGTSATDAGLHEEAITLDKAAVVNNPG